MDEQPHEKKQPFFSSVSSTTFPTFALANFWPFWVESKKLFTPIATISYSPETWCANTSRMGLKLINMLWHYSKVGLKWQGVDWIWLDSILAKACEGELSGTVHCHLWSSNGFPRVAWPFRTILELYNPCIAATRLSIAKEPCALSSSASEHINTTSRTELVPNCALPCPKGFCPSAHRNVALGDMHFRSSAQHRHRSASWCQRHLPSSCLSHSFLPSQRCQSFKVRSWYYQRSDFCIFLWHLTSCWLLPRTWQNSNQNQISSSSISLSFFVEICSLVVECRMAVLATTQPWTQPQQQQLGRTRLVICTAVWVVGFFRSTAGHSKTHGSAVIGGHECRHHAAATWLVDLERVGAHPVSGQSSWLLSMMIRSILLGFTISVCWSVFFFSLRSQTSFWFRGGLLASIASLKPWKAAGSALCKKCSPLLVYCNSFPLISKVGKKYSNSI